MQANNIKTKLKGLLKNVDNDKLGFIKYEVFFELIDLHNVKLDSRAINYLKKNYSKNQTINFKEAINQLTIDLHAAAGVDPDAKDGTMKWTVFGLAKAQSKIGSDSIS